MIAESVYHHTAFTRSVLRSLVPVVCPPEAETLADAITDHMELSMGALPLPVRAALIAGLASYDAAALLRFGARARRLDTERAQRYFSLWWHGPGLAHEFAKAVKSLLCLGCYELPEMQERLGYRPAEWIDKVKSRRLAVYSEDIRRHEASIYEPDPLLPQPGGAARTVPEAR